jgi:hypothetical protein
MIVVIPTNRSVSLDNLQPLIDAGARFIVVDDSEGNVEVDHPSFEVVTWQTRRKMLGPLDVAIPKRNGACRDFGFYLAWRESDDDELIVALDDDCVVYHRDFARRVESALSRRARPVATTAGRHLNILGLYAEVDPAIFPRGFPYSARVGPTEVDLVGEEEAEPAFSLGMWKGVFDINAIDKIRGPDWAHPEAELRHESVLIPSGKLISVCSMNMHFRRQLTPAVYQLPMHIEVMPDWVIDRYGDIWGGFILKTLMDIRGDAMAVGEPMIRHLKEGDYQRNIWQEHLCHLVNDEFLGLVEAAAEAIHSGPYLEMMRVLAEEFRRMARELSPVLRTYIEHLVPALDGWVQALSRP